MRVSAQEELEQQCARETTRKVEDTHIRPTLAEVNFQPHPLVRRDVDRHEDHVASLAAQRRPRPPRGAEGVHEHRVRPRLLAAPERELIGVLRRVVPLRRPYRPDRPRPHQAIAEDEEDAAIGGGPVRGKRYSTSSTCINL